MLCLLGSACQSDVEKLAASNQEEAIDRYISNLMLQDSSIVLTMNGGSYRLTFEKGQDPAAAPGDSIYFTYVGYIFANGKGTPFDTNMDTLGFKPMFDNGKGIAGTGSYIPGLEYGLLGMQEGELAQIVFPASLGFAGAPVGLVPRLSPLLYEVKMIHVKKT
jgi:FKBP-type peptidyl-prolyl cis-trans isomerase